MLPSYVETTLITLFGRMGDPWVKHRIFAGIKKRCWHSIGVA